MPSDQKRKKQAIITPDEGEHHHHHTHSPHTDEMKEISVEANFMERNRKLAQENLTLFDEHGIRTINILGSVGSGKTSLVEALVRKLGNRRSEILVIAGDVTTTIDADRIAEHGVRTIQVNTGVECHLDARLIRKALETADLGSTKIIFIENVGNLICPADFPLGSHLRLVVVSVTEGPWMVQKHPVMFHEADILVINKIDLAEAMEVNVDQLESDAKQINPGLVVFHMSIRKDVGVDDLMQYLAF